jgi:5-methylcytosine-specific restriction endonuclease McrA
MSRLYINAELRRLVSDRAAHLCEYCLYPEGDGLGFQVDHIISLKHGGATTQKLSENVRSHSPMGIIYLATIATSSLELPR